MVGVIPEMRSHRRKSQFIRGVSLKKSARFADHASALARSVLAAALARRTLPRTMSDIEENLHLSTRKRGKRGNRGSPPMYNEEEKFNILIGNIRKVKGRKRIKRKNIADSECEDEVNASEPFSDQVVVDACKNSDSNAKIDAWHQEEAEMYHAYGETSSKRARLTDEDGRMLCYFEEMFLQVITCTM